MRDFCCPLLVGSPASFDLMDIGIALEVVHVLSAVYFCYLLSFNLPYRAELLSIVRLSDINALPRLTKMHIVASTVSIWMPR
jgi:hypothetical protein